jgi:hypothetical protein
MLGLRRASQPPQRHGTQVGQLTGLHGDGPPGDHNKPRRGKTLVRQPATQQIQQPRGERPRHNGRRPLASNKRRQDDIRHRSARVQNLAQRFQISVDSPRQGAARRLQVVMNGSKR